MVYPASQGLPSHGQPCGFLDLNLRMLAGFHQRPP
jgi:hypothetical protein